MKDKPVGSGAPEPSMGQTRERRLSLRRIRAALASLWASRGALRTPGTAARWGAVFEAFRDARDALRGRRRTAPEDPPEAPSASPDCPSKVPVTLDVNGARRTLSIEPRVTLLDALREELGLTGAKNGCDHGQCGACTVLAGGRPIKSCMTLAIMQEGAQITTIEGLACGGELHPMQAAFIEHDAFQCGYCTSGQILSATALACGGRRRTPAEIREQMSGVLCRCGAYDNIVAAVVAAQGRE